MYISDGSAVDPDSKLEDVAHVYCEGKTKYFAILCNVDIAKDKNSYYKIQLLQSDDCRKYVKNWQLSAQFSQMLVNQKPHLT